MVYCLLGKFLPVPGMLRFAPFNVFQMQRSLQLRGDFMMERLSMFRFYSTTGMRIQDNHRFHTAPILKNHAGMMNLPYEISRAMTNAAAAATPPITSV